MLFRCALWVWVLAILTFACPPQETLGPKCKCKDLGDGPMLLCNGFLNAEELVPPIKASVRHNMFALNIVDSSILYIPSKLFVGTNFEKIRFANTQLQSLSDSSLAFEGLEDSLEELRVFESGYVTGWDWAGLREHRRLAHVDVFNVPLHAIDQELPRLDSLTVLSVSGAQVTFVHPWAFRSLDNLRMLVMRDNGITELSRGMFPEPATQLSLLDFSGNELVEIPTDLFSGMPDLQELKLRNNKFVTLKDDSFSWVVEHLNTLELSGNEFRCDCRMRWLVHSRTPAYFEGTCSTPEKLKGMKLKYLNDNQLWC